MQNNLTGPAGGNRFKSVDYLRVIATILITNAHLGELYPPRLSRLSFGGMFGDCLFFLISGYCLAMPRESFPQFLKRRYLRIYIPYFLCVLLLLPSGFFAKWQPVDYLFPIETYTFLPCIITLYPLYYLCTVINRKMGGRGFRWLVLLAMAVHVLYFFLIFDFRNNDASLTALYSFMQVSSFFIAMLLGGELRTSAAKPGENPRTVLWGLIALVFLGLFVLQSLRPLQGGLRILHWYLGFGFVYALAKLLLGLEPKLKSYKLIGIIAPLTLEIYLVQYVIISAFKNTPFYTGWILCIVSIAATAYLVNQIGKRILALLKLAPRT